MIVITRQDVQRRANEIAHDLRSEGAPVMGIAAPDDTQMVSLTFRLPSGRLMIIALHYHDATGPFFRRLLDAAGC